MVQIPRAGNERFIGQARADTDVGYVAGKSMAAHACLSTWLTYSFVVHASQGMGVTVIDEKADIPHPATGTYCHWRNKHTPR